MDTIFENIFSSLILFYSLVLIVFGLLYKYYPPKHISWFYGIQFKAAKRNQHTWQETHKYIPVPMIISGCILTLIGLLPIFTKNDSFFTFELAIGVNIISTFILYLFIERHLKRISV